MADYDIISGTACWQSWLSVQLDSRPHWSTTKIC